MTKIITADDLNVRRFVYYNNYDDRLSLNNGIKNFLFSPGTFRQCPDLIYLCLQNFEIINDDKFFFTSLTNLTTLSVGYINFLFSKDYLFGLVNLKYFTFFGKNLKMENNFFEHTPKVKNITFSENDLCELDRNFFGEISLTSITICNFPNYKIIKKDTFNFPSLKTLNIVYSDIEEVEDDSLSPSIKYLSLNFIEENYHNVVNIIRYLENLEKLDLTKCCLDVSEFDEFAKRIKKITLKNFIIDNYGEKIMHNDR